MSEETPRRRQLKNLIANYAGKGCVALLNLAFIPVYLRLLGSEAYGLVGVFTIVQTLTAVLDMGLGTTVNRELARASADPARATEMRDLVRTLELLYWAVALLLAALAWPAAGPIARHWVNAQTLSPDTIETALVLMGFAFALQWPVAFYTNGLMGLQRQVFFNALNVGVWTVRTVGAAGVLLATHGSVVAFFAWQVLTAALNVAAVAAALWRSLPPAPRAPRASREVLRRVWRFAASTAAMNALTIVYTQADKVVVSKLLTLSTFGFYTIAGQIAATLSMLYTPIYSVMFPAFTQDVDAQRETELRRAYHRGCQLVSVAILPTTIVIALFSKDVLLVWSGSDATAESAHGFVTFLMTASCLSGLIYLPFGLQLAFGRTRYIIYTYLVSLTLLLPTVVLLARSYGGLGAAMGWAIVNTVQLGTAIYFTGTRFLRDTTARWFSRDVGLPLAAALAVGLLARTLVVSPGSLKLRAAYLVGVLVATTAAAVLATPTTRSLLLRSTSRA